MKIFTVIGYAGSGFMIAFSFTMNPLFGIIGLLLLTIQTAKLKTWNLVVLNMVSIIGLFLNFLK